MNPLVLFDLYFKTNCKLEERANFDPVCGVPDGATSSVMQQFEPAESLY